MIEKEILIRLIAYNLVRSFMQRVSRLHHVDLENLSFKGALGTTRPFAEASAPRWSSLKRSDSPNEDQKQDHERQDGC